MTGAIRRYIQRTEDSTFSPDLDLALESTIIHCEYIAQKAAMAGDKYKARAFNEAARRLDVAHSAHLYEFESVSDYLTARRLIINSEEFYHGKF